MVDIHFSLLEGLPQLCSMFLEDVVVFNATLQQNLSIARPKASSEEMKEVRGLSLKCHQLGLVQIEDELR